MADRYREHGITFVFVYCREAHPGEAHPHHTSFEQKLEHARTMVERFAIRRPMLVDDLDGTLHSAYGRLPNMCAILSSTGKLVYRAAWTDARTIKLALEHMLYERHERRTRHRVMPYYVEWAPGVTKDREPFLEGLLENAGPRAVDEFIAAARHLHGEAASRPMQTWWDDRRK